MPNESAAGRTNPLPPELERDRRAFLTAIAREAEGRAPGDPIAMVLREPRALALWDRFAYLVFQQSARLALVAEGDRSRIYTRHILDSLNPLGILDPAPGSLLDIGSGAGFPGIPLAVAWPRTAVTLLESREKKVGFLERAIRELALSNATAMPARLEELGGAGPAVAAEAVTIRAVAGLAALLAHASRAAGAGARWVYFMGSDERAEGILATLDAELHRPRVAQGLFGGTFLTGVLRPKS